MIRFLFAFPLSLAAAAVPHLVPQPASLQMRTGTFQLRDGASIVAAPDRPEARRVASYLADALQPATGFHLKIVGASTPQARAPSIVLSLSAAPPVPAQPEGYRLQAGPRGVSIEASSAAGLFYGAQTLLQLLPPEIEGATVRNVPWIVPAVDIVDYPRFAWRGLLLDVSRHFFSKGFVKQYIDRMARYKFNVFHWHLTDDQGWRIQIRSEPRLTEVGAWRVPRLGRWWQIEPPREAEPDTYGGFYTQDDIREVVAYAQQRFVTVVPEIEMPGHAMAALAAYPELSCTGGPFRVNPGSKFYRQIDNAYCPGNEKTFEFLDRVLGEVAALFPSPYVHIGGDEAFKGFWQDCDKCRRRMADEHLKSADELQSYLVRRAEKILAAKGKKLIGWDEILDGGLADTATVMSWRGMTGGIAAAKMNHQVIMTPTQFSYLDLYQGDPALEPDTYSELRVSTCYRFEPVPDGVDPRLILGGQGNLWTESVPTPRHAEYMTWPRGFALAETLWSQPRSRTWDEFVPRMEAQFTRLEQAGVNYSRAVYDPAMAPVRTAAGKLAVRLSAELGGSSIYYTFDGTNPDRFSPKFAADPVLVPDGAYVVKAVIYREGAPSGRMLSLAVTELQDRLAKQKK